MAERKLIHHKSGHYAFIAGIVLAILIALIPQLRGDIAVWVLVTLGVIVGLVFGKQLGIFLFSWFAVKTGIATLPSGLSWSHIYGASVLAGVGFTMSLFIAGLALIDPVNLIMAKIGIIIGSLISGLLGFILLRYITQQTPTESEEASLTPH